VAAFVKIAAVLYLCKKAEKYSLIKYLLYLLMFMHVATAANNAHLLLWRLPTG
jgi:hypothetical protein